MYLYLYELRDTSFLCPMKTNQLIVKTALFLALLNGSPSCTAQPVSAPPSEVPPQSSPAEAWVGKPQDSLVFSEKITKVKGKILAERALSAAQTFIGTPYRSHTLEVSEPENTVINLRGLDCWTLMDAALAMAMCQRDSNPDFYNFVRHVRELRYKNGMPDGYGSRRHYFTEWLLYLSEQGIIYDITPELGGVPMKKKINFITANPALYPRTRDTAELNKIKTTQDHLNAQSWYYIPKTAVKKAQKHIRPGDIIVLTSVRSNLDVEHQGFAIYDTDGSMRLLHASSNRGRVMLSHRPLDEYLNRIKAVSGIMVFRFKE